MNRLPEPVNRPADDVTIHAHGTVILHASGSDSVNSLHSRSAILLSGGSLSLANASAVHAALVLTGGTLSAAGPLTLGTLEQTAGTLIGDWRKSGLQFVVIGLGAALLGYAISSLVSMFAGGSVAA